MLTAPLAHRTDFLSPPGDTLSELLEEQRLDQRELAARLGVTPKHVNEVISAKARITPELAVALERVLKVPTRLWLNLEATYREGLAKQQAILPPEEAKAWIARFPYNELAKHGWVPSIAGRATEAIQQKAEALLRFFGISGAAQWEEIWHNRSVAFRRSLQGISNEHAISAWLRAGELLAADVCASSYNKAKFTAAIAKTRQLAQEPIAHAVSETQQAFARAGVALVLHPAFKGSKVCGATYWLNNDLAVIQLNLRYKNDAAFWFTLAHEAAHIILHGKREVFLEGIDEDDREKEAEANAWASNFWIPTKTRQAFERAGDYSQAAVVALAERLGIPPGIVVGQLQHCGLLDFNQLNALKRKLDWVESVSSE